MSDQSYRLKGLGRVVSLPAVTEELGSKEDRLQRFLVLGSLGPL